MEYVPCTLCGADQPQELFRLRNDRFLRALDIPPPTSVKVMCGLCGHVYANPQLDSDELARLYRYVNRSPALGYSCDRPSREYLYRKKVKAHRDYQWLARHLPGLGRRWDVLEVGCAEGLLLSMLANDGCRVLGVEATQTYAAHAREVYRLEVLDVFFECVQLDDRQFDLVIALNTLEHVKDPVNFLVKIAQALKPGGFLYLQVPNVFRPGDSTDFFLSPHLCLFTPSTLQLMFSKAGFSPLIIDADGQCLSSLSRRSEGSEAMEVVPVGNSRGSFWKVRYAFQVYRFRCEMIRVGLGIRRRIKVLLLTVLGQARGEWAWKFLGRLAARSNSKANTELGCGS